MTRAFNIEGLVRLQNYVGGKTLSDAQFFAVLNADVVEMIDGEKSTTKRRYFRIAENDESITFSCILGSSQQQMVVTKATKQLDVTTTEIGGAIAPGPDVSGLFFILPAGTQLPYTLTDDDKEKIENAVFIVIPAGTNGSNGIVVTRTSSQGLWRGIQSAASLYSISVSDTISNISAANIVDQSSVKFTAQTLSAAQKTQARTNIGAAEDPNTPGDSPATLEEPIL